jgi:hypothetical protein
MTFLLAILLVPKLRHSVITAGCFVGVYKVVHGEVLKKQRCAPLMKIMDTTYEPFR